MKAQSLSTRRMENILTGVSSTWREGFLWSSGTLLLMTGCIKIFSSFGTSRILDMQDELLLLHNRQLAIGAGVLEIVVAILLFRCRNTIFSAAILLWLTSNFVLYRIGMYVTGTTLCPCLGGLYDKLGLKPEVAEATLKVMIVYFLVGSALVRWPERRRFAASIGSLHGLMTRIRRKPAV